MNVHHHSLSAAGQEHRLLRMSPGGEVPGQNGPSPEMLSKIREDSRNVESEVRVKSVEAANKLAEAYNKTSNADVQQENKRLSDTITTSAQTYYESLLPAAPAVPTEEQSKSALATVATAFRSIAEFSANGRALTLVSLNTGTRLMPGALRAVPENDRETMRKTINDNMNDLPDAVKKILVNAVETMTDAQLREIPALVKTIRATPNAGQVLGRAMGVNPANLPADAEAMRKVINAQVPAQSQEAVFQFLRGLNQDQRSILSALRTTAMQINAEQQQNVDDATVLKQARDVLNGFNPDTATDKQFAMMEARLQMAGIDIGASNIRVRPPTLKVMHGEPWERAMNKVMGVLSFLGSLGASNTRTNSANASPSSSTNVAQVSVTEKVRTDVREQGTKAIEGAALSTGAERTPRDEVINGTSTRVFAFREPGGATTVDVAFVNNVWSYKIGAEAWRQAQGGIYQVGDVEEARRPYHTMINAILADMGNRNEQITKQVRSDLEAAVKANGPAMNGKRTEIVPVVENGRAAFNLRILPPTGQDAIPMNDAQRRNLNTLGVNTVEFTVGTAVDNCGSITVKNITPDRMQQLVGLLNAQPQA